jgi:hypothetical protein
MDGGELSASHCIVSLALVERATEPIGQIFHVSPIAILEMVEKINEFVLARNHIFVIQPVASQFTD